MTYLEICNEILGEMNEVLLTSSTFSNATNIQRSVKDFVNRAYMDVNNPTHKWPWLAVASPANDFFGNTYIETVAGQRWYLLKDGSADFNSDYGHIDWEHVSLTTEGVSGETTPYTVRNLGYMEVEEWRDSYAVSEESSKYDSNSYTIPRRILRSPGGRKFGLSPIPDKVYRIYFFAWDRPSELTNHDDAVNLPDQYKPVLVSRARYYAWQRKENPQQAGIALDEYKQGLRGMKQQEIAQAPDRFTDDRIRWI
jgi:hypothetical protein